MKKLLLLLLLPLFVSAQGNGACSSHGGVDCGASDFSDGSVICMDGWRDSSVSYGSVIACKYNQDKCPAYVSDSDYEFWFKQINDGLQRAKDSNQQNCNYSASVQTNTNQQKYDLCVLTNNQKRTANGLRGVNIEEGLYDCNSYKTSLSNSVISNTNYCTNTVEMAKTINKFERLRSCLRRESELTNIKDTFCKKIIKGSVYDTISSSCVCPLGKRYFATDKVCMSDADKIKSIADEILKQNPVPVLAEKSVGLSDAQSIIRKLSKEELSKKYGIVFPPPQRASTSLLVGSATLESKGELLRRVGGVLVPPKKVSSSTHSLGNSDSMQSASSSEFTSTKTQVKNNSLFGILKWYLSGGFNSIFNK